MNRALSGLVVALVFFSLIFAASLTPVSDGDIWWHLAAGRELLRAGLLWTDPFSVGAAGRPWIDVHWLFQLGAFAVHQQGGVLALVVAKAALIAGGAVVLLAAVVRGARWDGARPDGDVTPAVAALLFVTVLTAALVVLRPLLLLRPVVVTLLFLALFAHGVERFRGGGSPRALWWLPVFQVIWANCQGLSVLGPVLLVCHAAGGWLGARWGRPELPPRGGRRLLLLAGACLVAGVLTPYGWRGLLLPLRLLARLEPTAGNVFSANIAENVPPFLLQRHAAGPLWMLPWFLALFAVSLVLGRRHLVMGRCLAAAGFIALAMLATRNVVLAVWMTAPVIALNLAPSLHRLHRRARWLRVPLIAAAGIGLAAMTILALRRDTALDAPAPFRVPAQSVRLIEERPGQGAIFAADHYGGYLIWTLFPRFRPFIDTRLILRTAAEYEAFLRILDDPPRFEALQAQHQFTYAVLPTAYPDRYLGLIAFLYRAPDWKLLDTDGTETLFVHDPSGTEAGVDLRSPDVGARLLSGLEARFSRRPELLRAARLQLARLQLTLEHVQQAQQVLASMTDRAAAPDAEAQALMAVAHLMSGELDAAETLARAAAAADPRAVAPLVLLARAALQRGDTRAGLAWVRRALALDPYDADANAVLLQVERASAPAPSGE